MKSDTLPKYVVIAVYNKTKLEKFEKSFYERKFEFSKTIKYISS